MPELPDVETFRRYIAATALHQHVAAVDVRDDRILIDTSPRGLGRRLHNKPFTETARHGKLLFVRIDTDGWLVLHFGMTGFPRYYKNDNDEPEHAKVVFRLDNGYRLAYACQRMLGQVTYTDNRTKFVEAQELGPDALDDDMDSHAFRERFAGRSATIKSLLMNQAIIAGIGNVYADEILFQAAIHPETSVAELDDSQWSELYRTMRRALNAVSDKQADPARLPRSYLLPHREEDTPCPRCDGTIERIETGGRPTYYCASHQE